jgi:uncharacterized RDD family membrane protein YckC
VSAEISPGWYTDRTDSTRQRWWDGADWSHVTRPMPPSAPASSDPVPLEGAEIWGSPGPSQAGCPQPQAGGAWLAGPITPDGVLLANPALRLLARAIDAVCTLLITAAVGWPYLRQAVTMETAALGQKQPTAMVQALKALAGDSNFLDLMLRYELVGLACGAVYTISFIAAFGATPGKFAVGLRVRRWDRAGRPSIVQAMARWMTREGFSAIPFLLFGSLYWLIDTVWLLFDPRRQCLHDKMAQTVVVRVR